MPSTISLWLTLAPYSSLTFAELPSGDWWTSSLHSTKEDLVYSRILHLSCFLCELQLHVVSLGVSSLWFYHLQILYTQILLGSKLISHNTSCTFNSSTSSKDLFAFKLSNITFILAIFTLSFKFHLDDFQYIPCTYTRTHTTIIAVFFAFLMLQSGVCSGPLWADCTFFAFEAKIFDDLHIW